MEKNSQFDKEIDFVEKNQLTHSHPLLGGKSPVDIWRLIFDDKIISSLVEQINLYEQRDKNCPDFCIIAADLLKFFGIILLSGFNTLPEEIHYRSNEPDLGVPIVLEAMNSKQFLTIKRFLAHSMSLYNRAASVVCPSVRL